MEKYGQRMELLDAQGKVLRSVQGFLQPLAFSDTDALWCPTPGGGVRQEKYLLITAADAIIGDGEERALVFRGRRYVFERADKFDTPAGAAHWEAILRQEGEQLP